VSTRAITPTVGAPVAVLAPTQRPMLQRTCDCGQHTGGSECEECKKNKTALQRRVSGPGGTSVAPPIVHEVLTSAGQPLDPTTRAFMEPRFQHDFSQVRVHADAKAAESARSVNALAYTVGHNLVFAGKYEPESEKGRHLLAHELTHVVQQTASGLADIQHKLEVGPVNDRFEKEADEVAERVLHGPGSPRESVLPEAVSMASPVVQRAAAAESVAPSSTGQDAANSARPSLIVEDDARDLRSGQMRKGDFLDKLKVGVCAAADEELAAVGRTAQGCPYVERWIAHFRVQSNQHVERAIRKYAPDSAGVTNAAGYIPFVVARVRRGVARWARTGEITEVPDELKGQLLAANALGAVEKMLSGIGGAIAGAASAVVGGVKKAASAVAGVFAKAREGGVRDAGDLQAIQAELGAGHPLDGGVKSQMESAFGGDFSQVRIHTDSTAASLSTQLNARAFTIGRDVAFGMGEYQPGTLIGDALIAHELAHVVQQENGSASVAPKSSQSSEYGALEDDADISALGAVASLWGRSNEELRKFASKAGPSLRSGLRLQNCGGKTPKPAAGIAKPEPSAEKSKDTSSAESPEVTPVRHDAFGKECPDTIEIAELKSIPAFNKKMFDAGYRTYFGIVSNMRVGPKDSYEACITEVLAVQDDGCGDKGNIGQTTHCGENKPCMQVSKDCGGDPFTGTTFPCSPNTFVDRHRTAPKERTAQTGPSLMEGTGKTECKVTCLQRYGCGGKEIGRFLITRTYKAGVFQVGANKVPITTGTIEKVSAKK
jgi:hypothetical protein